MATFREGLQIFVEEGHAMRMVRIRVMHCEGISLLPLPDLGATS
jgi:hypothetical protein